MRCGAPMMKDELDELFPDDDFICWDCKIQKGGLL